MLTNKTPWIIGLLIWIGVSTWWHVCQVKQLCADTSQSAEVASTEPAAGLTITDGSRFSLFLPGNFSFAKSDPLANRNELDAQLDTLALYLLNNPDRHLDITGYYTADEQNNTSFPNLGIARAEDLKEYLSLKGVPITSITTNGIQNPGLHFSAKGDSILGGLAFGFSNTPVTVAVNDSTATPPASASTVSTSASSMSVSPPNPLTAVSEEELANAQKYSSIFQPMDLYFKSGSSEYIKTDETKKFFKEAIQFLKNNKDKKLRLVGFTDDQGPEEINKELSRKRANYIKSRLSEYGISGNQIIVEAKGKAEPRASNETEAGRKANRRVSVVVLN